MEETKNHLLLQHLANGVPTMIKWEFHPIQTGIIPQDCILLRLFFIEVEGVGEKIIFNDLNFDINLLTYILDDATFLAYALHTEP